MRVLCCKIEKNIFIDRQEHVFLTRKTFVLFVCPEEDTLPNQEEDVCLDHEICVS